jgi:hypothetical protein
MVLVAAISAGCSDDADGSGRAGGAGAAGGAGGSGGAGGGGGSGGTTELDIAICDPAHGPSAFSVTIDNPYLPIVVGTVMTLSGEPDGELEEVVITVTDETREVAGITTRVVEEHEEADGVLVEISRNYFVQAVDGTVCYYGEEVDIYDETGTMIVAHDGAWLAGEGENKPGILMPANPAVGQSYQQEVAPGIAMDRAEIISIGEPYTVPFAMYADTLSTVESSPLDAGATSEKTYARDVGLIFDSGIELTDLGM